MTQEQRARKLTDRQLWFIWKIINDLRDMHLNQLENGAKDGGYYDKGRRAQQLIQQQRLYNKQQKKSK